MTAVDATCGNGHDTLFLARLLGPHGVVHAFDIQKAALEATQAKIDRAEGALAPVHLHHTSHEHAADQLDRAGVAGVHLAVFNLGYLPGGDKAIATSAPSTLAALEALAARLLPGGLISAVLYRAHPGGLQESEEVTFWISNLPVEKWNIWCYSAPQHNRFPRPVWLGLWRKNDPR